MDSFRDDGSAFSGYSDRANGMNEHVADSVLTVMAVDARSVAEIWQYDYLLDGVYGSGIPGVIGGSFFELS